MRAWGPLGLILLLLSAAAGLAAPQQNDCPVAVKVDKYVGLKLWVQFDEGDEAYLDVEAGYESAASMVDFTAYHNCPALLTLTLIPPPTAPAELIWDYSFQGEGTGQRQLALSDAGIYDGRIRVHVKGVTPTTPAGRYSGGFLIITITAL